MNAEAQLAAGRQADALMNDPVLSDAFEEVRLGIHSMIETSAFDQDGEREDAYHMLRALKSVRIRLESKVRIAAGIRAEEEQQNLFTVKRVVEQVPE